MTKTTPPPVMTDPPSWTRVSCPRCQALAGQSCLNPNGTKYKYVHKARFEHARQNPPLDVLEQLHHLAAKAPGNWSEGKKCYEACLVLKPKLAIHIEQERPELFSDDHKEERYQYLAEHWLDPA